MLEIRNSYTISEYFKKCTEAVPKLNTNPEQRKEDRVLIYQRTLIYNIIIDVDGKEWKERILFELNSFQYRQI